MNGLLKQQVLRFTEHPVTKLACRELAQRYIADRFCKPGLSQSTGSNGPQQFAKCGMKHEVLIHADRNAIAPAFSHQRTAFMATDRNRLFNERRYAGLNKWQGG